MGFKWCGRVKEKRKGADKGGLAPGTVCGMSRVERQVQLVATRNTNSVPIETTVAHLGLDETPTGYHHLHHS